MSDQKDKELQMKCPQCGSPLKYSDVKSLYPQGYWYCAECNAFFAKRKEGYGWRKKEQVLRGWHSEWEVTIIGETTKV